MDPRAEGFVPDALEEVTAAWLSEALGRPITAATLEPLDAGIGFIGRTARARLLTDDDGDANVVVKLPGPDGPARSLGVAGGMYEREARFYAEVASVVGIRVPRPLAVRMDLDAGRFALVLEDLAPARPGDQLAGATTDEALAAVDVAARLHARWHERLDPSAWPWLPRPEKAHAPLAEAAATGLPAYLDTIGPELEPQQVRMAELVSTRLLGLLATQDGPPHTLVHGDYRLDNLLFDDDGIIVADWQLVAAAADGAADLVLLLASSFDSATRAALFDPVLDHYVDRLRDQGVDAGPDGLRRGMQRATAVCVARMISAYAIPSPNERGRAMRRRMYEGYWDLAARVDLTAALVEV